MFENRITNPISPITLSYLKKYRRISSDVDYTMIMLGIGLLKPRMDFKGFNGETSYSSANAVISKVTNNENNPSEEMPSFYYFITSDSDFNNTVNELRKFGLKELEMITKFAEQELAYSKFSIFISEKTNSAYLISENSSFKVYHLVLAFIPLLYPKYFKDSPLNSQEGLVLKALCYRKPEEFIKQMSVLLDPLKNEVVKQELIECFKGYRKNRIDLAKNNVDSKRNDCEEILQRYRRMVEELNYDIVILEGLMVAGENESEEERELIDFISENKHIRNIKYENKTLNFDISTILSNFDSQKWERAKTKYDIYSNYRLEENNPFNQKEYRIKFLNAIFSAQPSLYVKMRGNITLDTYRNWMDASRRYTYNETDIEIGNCLTNPHFDLHGCPGQNRSQIINCLSKGELIAALECCIAATGSVNIDEAEITFRPFVQQILSSDKKCIITSDNSCLTPKEALLWLIKKEKENVA